MLHANIFQEET